MDISVGKSDFINNGKGVLTINIITKGWNEKWFDTIWEEIIIPLKERFGKFCNFNLIMKNDFHNNFRLRSMKTDYCLVEFRKGFELFNRKYVEKFNNNNIFYTGSSKDHRNEINDIDCLQTFKEKSTIEN